MITNTSGLLRIKSHHNYNAAEKLLDADPKIVGDQVFGLLLQQSVEKAIKSILWKKGLKPDNHIHNVDYLLGILSRKIDVPPKFKKLAKLTMYASYASSCESPLPTLQLNRQERLDLVHDFLALLEGIS